MNLENIQPICSTPECQQGAQILSKQGDSIKYMLTCRRHWYGSAHGINTSQGGHNHETEKTTS
jgi:hypothetical protein